MKKINLDELYNKGVEMHHITNTAYPLTPRSFMNYKVDDSNKIRKLLEFEINQLDELSLYVHIPFCQSRCKFCEYAVVSGEENELKDKYVEYLFKEFDMYKDLIGNKKIVGFDMGGGTPTQLSTNQIKKITDYLRKNFNFDKNVVMSIETTPVIAASNPDKIKTLKKIGYDRISMGFQTISSELLKSFEREGGVRLYKKAIDNIRKAGFNKLNIDLMYGFLNQSLEDFSSTIEYTISMNPEYITLYRNRYKGTKIAYEAENVSLDKVNTQYKLAHRLLNESGYEGNYCKNTFSRIKNDYGTSDYLTNRVIKGTSYVGFGLGAQSFGNQYLAYNEGALTKQLKEYFNKIDKKLYPIQDIYKLPKDEAIAKMISVAFYFGFINLKDFEKRFDITLTEYFKEEIEYLIENNLVYLTKDQMIVTEKGTENIGGVIPMFYSQESKQELMHMNKI